MRIRTLAALAVATTMLGLGVASPANADVDDCPAGALCAWLGEWGTYARGQVYQNNSNLLQYNTFNNAESIWNNGNSCNVRVYNGTNYSGSSYVLQRGYGTGVLYGTAYYHDVASNRWCV
jgi:hypothetical protein